ncbi:glycosyltransferase [Limobrevibacterium gyesilva]|uniref:Beta-monoglucosyldiacylglycerol synthase n=1 Tax=Limobrevibacterium gyesilva TaxID=2991712 RepID=A0AA42CE96_9PROT|nr:glycosyltransferase [Limobrevibacterium gyesilva]MCW3475788.1 glycosyltransferase [Limobrevibacterium gyesilva]
MTRTVPADAAIRPVATTDAPADAPSAGRASAFLHPATLLAVLLCACLAMLAWAGVNRPAAVPDFHGRVAGLAFSPFQRGQSPEDGSFPTTEEIRRDLATAAGITDRIRTYTVQGRMADIPRLAAGMNLHVTLGAWLSRDAAANRQELDRLIETARGAHNVERAMVGNETVLRGDLTVGELVNYLNQARQSLDIPVSTAEPWHVWLKHPELAQAVDFITIHLLPYWEGLPVDDAQRFLLEKLAAVHAAFPGKRIVIGEVGWPSDGVAQGAAHASRVNQALFLRRFFADAQAHGLDYFVMEAFDQPWKTSFEGRAAGYWGMLDLDRQAKWAMVGPVEETPSWPLWAAPSAGLAAVIAWLLLSRRPDIRLPGKLLLAGLAQGFAATLACVLLAMAGKYLSAWAGVVWGLLAAGQALLLVLLLADSFELAETIWGRVWRRRPAILPAPMDAPLPKVSIHVPICNEPPHMVRRTLDALAELDYPDFEVLVVDNNTTDPGLWEPVAEHCSRLGPRFRFFTLGRWPGFKAGALNFALRETAADADVVAVLDSDYAVSPDWLRCMVPQFANPAVGFVQSPQDYRDSGETFFKRLMFWEYAGFFHLGMVTRNERNAIIQHGTMTLIRKQALVALDGWAEWCICEDAELGLRLFRQGWQAVYSSRSFGRGVMPDDFAAYRKQRFRWAYGAMQICRRHWAALLNPFNRDLTLGQRWHFVTGWLPWVGDALGLVFLLLGLGWSVGLILAPQRFEFPIVLFMLPSVGLFVFKLVQILMLYRNRVPCGLADRAGAAVAGLALSHAIGKAVWKGLVVRSAPFLRTPKMKDAPALVQGLVMAREEAVLLLLTLAALVGVAVAHRFATWEAVLWSLVLLTQALPYAASVFVSIAASRPARRLVPALRPAASPQPALPQGAEWSHSAAGD